MLAILRFAPLSPQKVRLVADQIRGLPVATAVNVLRFSPKRAAKALHKLLNSAIANAENNFGVDIDELFVDQIMVDEGPRQKRFRARARGRANRICKRYCHVRIQLN